MDSLDVSLQELSVNIRSFTEFVGKVAIHSIDTDQNEFTVLELQYNKYADLIDQAIIDKNCKPLILVMSILIGNLPESGDYKYESHILNWHKSVDPVHIKIIEQAASIKKILESDA